MPETSVGQMLPSGEGWYQAIRLVYWSLVFSNTVICPVKLGVLIERPLQNYVQVPVVSVLELHWSALLAWESIVVIERPIQTYMQIIHVSSERLKSSPWWMQVSKGLSASLSIVELTSSHLSQRVMSGWQWSKCKEQTLCFWYVSPK